MKSSFYFFFNWLKRTKSIETKLDGKCIRMQRAILIKSREQHPTKQQPHSYLAPSSTTIQLRRTSPEGHCWRRKDEIISDLYPLIPSQECVSVGRPDRTYIQQLCTDTGYIQFGRLTGSNGWQGRLERERESQYYLMMMNVKGTL